MAKMALFI